MGLASGAGYTFGFGGPTNSVSPLIMCMPLNLAAWTGDLAEDSFPATAALSKSSLLRSCGENRFGIARPLESWGPIFDESYWLRNNGDCASLMTPYVRVLGCLTGSSGTFSG